ncbi:MAG: hypothetical protein HOQ24_04005 [Mycobacteriaceae bacterium]|nr:hypothetical protein [Mycobacteriaceae bacterium]
MVRAAAAVLVAAGLPVAAAKSAGAYVEFPQVPSLYYGGLCWGNIRTWADTNPAWDGKAIINIQGLPIQGIGNGSHPLAPLCHVNTTVHWRNTTTGAAGRYPVNLVTGIYGSIQYALFQPTGPGHVEVTVTTDNAHIASHGAFDVPGSPAPTG